MARNLASGEMWQLKRGESFATTFFGIFLIAREIRRQNRSGDSSDGLQRLGFRIVDSVFDIFDSRHRLRVFPDS